MTRSLFRAVILILSVVLLLSVFYVIDAKLKLLEARVEERDVEILALRRRDIELGRKIDSLRNDLRIVQCKYDVAVAGLRGGHHVAYVLMREGVLEACDVN